MGEEFVSDVATEILTTEAFRTFVAGLVENVRGEFDEKVRSLESQLREKVEAVEDTPSRNKRTTVKPFYRARFNRNAIGDVEDVRETGNKRNASQEIAEQTLSNIFGGK